MELSVAEDIRSVTDLKRDANGMLKRVRRTHRPMVLTVNGRAEAVLMAAQDYDRMSKALAVLGLIAQGEKDVAEGRTRPAAEFFREFRRARSLRG